METPKAEMIHRDTTTSSFHYTSIEFSFVKRPILLSLMDAARTDESLYQWLMEVPMKRLEIMAKRGHERSVTENADMTSAAIYYMQLDNKSNASVINKDVDDFVAYIEMSAYIFMLNRKDRIHLPKKHKQKLDMRSMLKLVERASKLIVNNIFAAKDDLEKLLDKYFHEDDPMDLTCKEDLDDL